MITTAQIKLLRTACSRLGFGEEEYRALLLQYGCKSAKELDQEKLEKVMANLKKLGFRSEDKRPKGYDVGVLTSNATTAQLRMIEGLWMEKAKVKTREALSKFAKRITGIDKIEWLETYHIRKLKKAIEAL